MYFELKGLNNLGASSSIPHGSWIATLLFGVVLAICLTSWAPCNDAQRNERGTTVADQKIDEVAAAKAADAEDAKTHVTEGDVKAVEGKLLSFAAGLGAGERKHLWTLLDAPPEKGADVQGFWWRDSWRARWWRDRWHR